MNVKRFGCVAGILGVLAIVAGCTLFSFAIVRALQAHAVTEQELVFGREQVVEATVSTARLCQVSVRVTVVIPAGTVRSRSSGGFDAEYDFPLHYIVEDGGERQLVSEKVAVASTRGTRTITQDTVGAEGGTFVAEHGFAKFAPPADGRLRVRCTLATDAKGVVGRDPRLIISDNVSEHGRTVGGGFALIALGGAAAVVGLVLFVVGTARRA